jgi:precorrin-8X/cobalt-precorrin-8 methylmutase
MREGHLTIKELTDAVGGGVTPRMVRHYHTLGLMSVPTRSEGNYRRLGRAAVAVGRS